MWRRASTAAGKVQSVVVARNNGSLTCSSASGLALGFNWLPMKFNLLRNMEFVTVPSLLQLRAKQFVQFMC
jgi:hypothetical protein